MKALYFTHCCAKKDDSLRNTGKKVSPMQLYQATPTQRFMKRCTEVGVEWAIFSDKYGFVFPDHQIQWYEKHPDTVTCFERKRLFDDALIVLRKYEYAYFYYNPSRIHPFYQELIDEMKRRSIEVQRITHLDEILR